MKITAETLRRERDRRARERAELADDYEAAADELADVASNTPLHSARRRALRRGEALLRAESARWQR